MAGKDLIYIRVLEHDTCDQIRIGCSFPIFDGDQEKAVKSTIDQYDKQFNFCGGWNEGNANKYYKRIALVDAKTLQSIVEIWNKK